MPIADARNHKLTQLLQDALGGSAKAGPPALGAARLLESCTLSGPDVRELLTSTIQHQGNSETVLFCYPLRANEHVTARAELAGDSIETREPCEVHCWMLGPPRALQSGREPEPVNFNAFCSYKLQHARDRLIRQDSAVVTKLSARTAHLGH